MVEMKRLHNKICLLSNFQTWLNTFNISLIVKNEYHVSKHNIFVGNFNVYSIVLNENVMYIIMLTSLLVGFIILTRTYKWC